MMKKLWAIVLSVLLCMTVLSGCGTNRNPGDEGKIDAAVFDDLTVTYDGQKHGVTVSGIPSSVRVEYENNEQTDAGTYDACAKLYVSDSLKKTLHATLTINKRAATVTVADGTTTVGGKPRLSYTADGVLEGDDLGVTLSLKTGKNGIKQVQCAYANQNYDVTFEGGKYTVIGSLFDSSSVTAHEATFAPSWAPFVLSDKEAFAETVITSFSFMYGGLQGKTVSDSGLTLPLYIVPKSTTNTVTASRGDYTVENGKKILLDFTGKLSGVQSGDWVTADGLQINVGKNETLAIGDTDMVVLPLYTRSVNNYSFYSKIFGSGGQLHQQSLIFKINGYSTAEPEPDDGKRYISFLGDSISTYAGYSDSTHYNSTIGINAIWFPNSNYSGADMDVKDTWWHRALTELDYSLCVNNSWSGSVVKDPQTYNVRAKNLHNADRREPDVVVIFMGVNDFAAGASIGTYDGTTDAPANPSNFSEAYGRTVQTITETYPDAEVYCCTFLPDRKRFSTDFNNSGLSETEYNAAIRTIAGNLEVGLIDLYADSGISAANISEYTVDNLHPNADGMALIADLVTNTILGKVGRSALALAA